MNVQEYIIWGTTCSCGHECYVLQNKYHPWDESDFRLVVRCEKCSANVTINQSKAAAYYNNRIYDYFKDIDGDVLDIGCGGGFLTRYILDTKPHSRVYGLDVKECCQDELDNIIEHDNFELIIDNISNLYNLYKDIIIDYIICRDVLMFIEDIPKFIRDINKLSVTELRFMGWYMPYNPRVKNIKSPEEITDMLKQEGWNATVELLDWYKSGYFIKAKR